MSVDSDLLARSGQAGQKNSGDKAGDLRQERRASQSGNSSSDANQALANNQPASLRQAVQEKRSLANMAAAKAKKSILAAISPIRRATSQLLQKAWPNAPVFPGCLLAIPWINLHVLLGIVFGHNVFCKLGQEWTDTIPAAQSSQTDKLKKGASIGEGALLGCLDLGCLLFVLIILFIISMIAGFFDNPFKAIASILGDIWHNLVGD